MRGKLIDKIKSRAAFTLIEVIAVMFVLGVLAAASVPSMLGYIEHGRQTGRMNIARTLYLAAQDRLIRSVTDRNLKETLTKYHDDNTKLPGFIKIPEDNPDNADYIYYISKPGGYELGGDDLTDAFYNLLDEIILDKAILNGALLMEYNIRTGVVLSVFYGDAGQSEFSYYNTPENGDNINNVTGGRGFDNYTHASKRKQGYYGANPAGAAFAANIPEAAYIYDGFDKNLNGKVNILYAEFLLSEENIANGEEYIFEIINAANGVQITAPVKIGDLIPGVYAGGLYKRYIWILDEIPDGADIVNTPLINNNISGAAEPVNIKAKVTKSDGASFNSLSTANTHFYYNPNRPENNFEIKSARHLNNIRRISNQTDDKIYIQTENINMSLEYNGVANFKPVDNFRGEYNGNGKNIENIKINAPGTENAGLFGNILNTGSVRNLTLINPEIKGGINAGSVAGINDGAITNIYVSFTENPGTENRQIYAKSNAGGIVGVNLNGGTIANATFVSPDNYIRVISDNNAGGITGQNGGVTDKALFLAVSPKNKEINIINPIAGEILPGGILTDTYYLSGEGIIPEQIKEYNLETPNEILSQGVGTDGILQYNPGLDWTYYAELDTEEILNPDNKIYPYPFYSGIQTPESWPVVKNIEPENISVENLFYYEIYAGEEPEIYRYLLSGEVLPDNKLVVHDGYGIEFSHSEDGEYITEIYGAEFDVEISDGKGYLYIPNGFIETLGESLDFNPNFAPEEYGLIRSPRHIANISKFPADNYTQQLNADFKLYRKELGELEDLSNGEAMIFNAAVINSDFTGEYNGGGNIISGVVINGGDNNNTGLFAYNRGEIHSLTLEKSEINGNNNVGGIAGTNSGIIRRVSVEQSEINGGINLNNNVGGVAGNNTGIISDVYFLSVNNHNNIPVSENGGGIAGNNAGIVSRAFYLAPAPVNENTGEFYPIVRKGEPATVNIINGGPSSFFLSGHRYSTDKRQSWINSGYNLETGGKKAAGGGVGLNTEFLEMDWLDFYYKIDKTEWEQNSDYPYLFIKNMGRPLEWTVTDSPPRPEQADRSAWDFTEPNANRAASVEFKNGDFSDVSYMEIPDAVTGTGAALTNLTTLTPNPYSPTRHFVNQDYITGWNTRPVNPDLNGLDAYQRESVNWVELQMPLNDPGYDANGWWNPSAGQWWTDEHNNYLNDFMYSDYKGNYAPLPYNINDSDYRYAELNAEIPGTLYQVCPTTPETQFIYSFYHASRLRTGTLNSTKREAVSGDRMNFYLTGIDIDSPGLQPGDSLTLIRPCRSPRRISPVSSVSNQGGSQNPDWNPDSWNTVRYEDLETVYTDGEDLSYYRDRFSEDPDWPADNKPYLYDVWIADSGYGITFWSPVIITGIPDTGVGEIRQLLSADAKADGRIIGYWGVEYGWKHYYGIYEVPDGQFNTEFAFRSRETERTTTSNYLDGVSFLSPAFLSVNSYIKDENGESDVMFTLPGSVLTVEINVINYGEITAENILITNQIKPFDEYIKYIGNVKINGLDSEDTAVFDENGGVLKFNPGGLKLETNEEIKITFQIEVLTEVKDDPNKTTTLLYYFKNQTSVSYSQESGMKLAALSHEYRNASGPEPVQVYINPVKLTKTVEELGHNLFEITLKAENVYEQGAVNTRGLVTEWISGDFRIADKDSLDSSVFVIDTFGDGSSRIVAHNVNLSPDEREREIKYRLEYTGKGYGVSYLSMSSDYRYETGIESVSPGQPIYVSLAFPQPVAGIPVKTADNLTAEDFTFIIETADTHMLDITRTVNFSSGERLAHDDYNVTPEIFLVKFTDGDSGEYELTDSITNDDYGAVINKGSGRLEFTLTPGITDIIGEEREYIIRYKILLTAEKSGSQLKFNLDSDIIEIKIIVKPQNGGDGGEEG